ncbi:MAG TPA: hypothetical protein VIN71_00030 [Pseudomonadales bacterium]
MNLYFLTLLLCLPLVAHAYVGPGIGLGALMTLLTLLLAFAATLWQLVWQPLKRLFSKAPRQQAQEEQKEETGQPENNDDPDTSD